MIVNKSKLNKLENLMLTKMMKICKWILMSLNKKMKDGMKAREMVNQIKISKSSKRIQRGNKNMRKVSSLV